MVGFIAATVIYVIFVSGMINADMFPKLVCEIGEGKCCKFLYFLHHWKQSQATDYAKAIVWGFVSGFSERFVPDILNRISEKSNS